MPLLRPWPLPYIYYFVVKPTFHRVIASKKVNWWWLSLQNAFVLNVNGSLDIDKGEYNSQRQRSFGTLLSEDKQLGRGPLTSLSLGVRSTGAVVSMAQPFESTSKDSGWCITALFWVLQTCLFFCGACLRRSCVAFYADRRWWPMFIHAKQKE